MRSPLPIPGSPRGHVLGHAVIAVALGLALLATLPITAVALMRVTGMLLAGN